jgi:hypothetical protein
VDERPLTQRACESVQQGAHIEPESAQPTLISSLQGHETILLVEDDDILRILTRNMLVRFGYTVLEASNGRKHATSHASELIRYISC